MGRNSFKRPETEDRVSATSFWQRLFGRKSVRQESLRRPAARPASSAPQPGGNARDTHPVTLTGSMPLGMPLDVPQNPRSFVARKFDSNVVKLALIQAIARADAQPPADLDPIGRHFWSEGLALKRSIVEGFDCTRLPPDAHLRAIQWMAAVERLDPSKATYREDLFLWRFKLGWVQDKDLSVPPAITQGGLALRKLYSLIRQKTDSLASIDSGGAIAVTSEIEAYGRLTTAIEAAAEARLEDRGWSLLANVFSRIDPYRYELTFRHPRFSQNVEALLGEIANLASPSSAPTS